MAVTGLQGRTAFVTGAGSEAGIGFACARALGHPEAHADDLLRPATVAEEGAR